MHIFFSGIGGSGIGPLALIAKQAGYDVSGSDKQQSDYTNQLQKQGINLYIGQTLDNIQTLNSQKPIDWFVYSSSVALENSEHPEILFAKNHNIKTTKRDELLNQIIKDQNLQLLAVAGTHGKSTTTAMIIWLFYQLGIPIGHSVGAKISFAPMGDLQKNSKYFVYECDEFDNNFLAFNPALSIITGLAWDHHEVFPNPQSYKDAYKKFINQSAHTIIWQDDLTHLELNLTPNLSVINKTDPHINSIKIPGIYNRQDAWLAILAVHKATKEPINKLLDLINKFPGLKQRMEKLAPNLYTNYAHTPEKIKGGLLTAKELAGNKKIIVIYEPLTNRRQHYIKEEYKNCFEGADKIYWTPTYLAREDPNLPVLSPADLIKYLADPKIAEPANQDANLLNKIKNHLAHGDVVVAMGASGAGSLDDWLRKNFK